MEENDSKRMAGDYEIIHAIHIGDREIVLGENPLDKNGQKYMTAFCETNDLFMRCYSVLVSDDFLEMVKYFGERVVSQASKTRDELYNMSSPGIDYSPITAQACHKITHEDDINGRIIVIKPEALRREYRVSTYQIKLCEGGFGASSSSRGSAVYCKNLLDGKGERYERYDVLGTLEKDELPQWAQSGLERLIEDKKTHREEAR